MASAGPPPPPPLAVARGARFEGLVLLPGSGRIEGRVDGRVVARGTLWIGEQAAVVGDVEAAEAVVAGHVEGDVRVAGRISLESTAHVRGEVSAARLVLAEGCFLEGGCQAGDGARPDEPAAAAAGTAGAAVPPGSRLP